MSAGIKQHMLMRQFYTPLASIFIKQKELHVYLSKLKASHQWMLKQCKLTLGDHKLAFNSNWSKFSNKILVLKTFYIVKIRIWENIHPQMNAMK